MSDTPDNSETKAVPPPASRLRISTRALGVGGAVAVLIAGAALGAGGTRLAQNWEPQRVMLLQPSSIGELRDDTPVTIKGEVGDIFGNKFIVQDATGRALVDTGPRGEDRRIVTRGEAITVQGRFDDGVVRAQLLVHADGRSEAFGPPHGPKGGPKDGPKGPKGPKDGPRADRDGPPPPPPRERADRAPPPPPPPAWRAGPDGDAPPPPPPPPAR